MRPTFKQPATAVSERIWRQCDLLTPAKIHFSSNPSKHRWSAVFNKIFPIKRPTGRIAIPLSLKRATSPEPSDPCDPFLRIRIVGWYGFHSTGDDLMEWCIERIFRKRAEKLGAGVEFTASTHCDLCVIGGGTIIGCDTSRICSRVEPMEAPLAIFGPGFRNTGESECRQWAPKMRALFDRSFISGVRGPRTAEALRHYGMAKNVAVVGDCAVWFEPLPLPWQPSTPHVGVIVRSMKNTVDGSEERYLSQKETFQKLAALIPRIAKRLSAKVVLLSFAENQFDSDSEAAGELRAMLPKPYQDAAILPYCDDIRFNPSIISQLDYVISERMHPSIIAWLSAKPCVMLENQYGKSMDFMAGIGMERYCLRTDNLNVDRYMGIFEENHDPSEKNCIRPPEKPFNPTGGARPHLWTRPFAVPSKTGSEEERFYGISFTGRRP